MTTARVYQVQTQLHELASKVYILAMGLQNAAPTVTVGGSILYLLAIAKVLEEISSKVENLAPNAKPNTMKPG